MATPQQWYVVLRIGAAGRCQSTVTRTLTKRGSYMHAQCVKSWCACLMLIAHMASFGTNILFLPNPSRDCEDGVQTGVQTGLRHAPYCGASICIHPAAAPDCRPHCGLHHLRNRTELSSPHRHHSHLQRWAPLIEPVQSKPPTSIKHPVSIRPLAAM